jgi:VIT1/CCC1 family predicted Fe2+/Mn2+ transporter
MHLEASDSRSWRSGRTPMTTRSWQQASLAGSRSDGLPARPIGRVRGRDGSMAVVSWLRGSINRVNLDALRDHARASILDVNDGITSAAGIAEGFISAGASTRTLLLAGAVVILAGGSAAAGARFSEVRTEWEMDRALLEAERASIETDPAGEFEELVGIYEAKGLDPRLARQVAEALTELDPVAAHADAELRLEALGPTSGAVPAALIAGLCFGTGAAIPLAAMTWLPRGELLALTFVAILLALGLTGWFAAWLTGLPVIRLVRRNIVLGSAVMVAGILAGLALD